MADAGQHTSGWTGLDRWPRDVAVRRAWPSAVAGVVALSVLQLMAWDSGGYFPHSYLLAGLICCFVLALLLVLRPPHYQLSSHALAGLACLVGLALWTAISTRWSPAPDRGLDDLHRLLTYCGLFGLALIAAGSGRLARYLVWGVLLSTLVIVGAGLLSRLFPPVWPPVFGVGGYRLEYPLSYWNAYGALASLGTVLGLGLAADPSARAAARAASAGATVVMGTAMYLSFSRGAWLALFLGLAILALLTPHRGAFVVTAAVVLPMLALSVGRVHDFTALTENPFVPPGQPVAGSSFAQELVLLVGVVAFLQWGAASAGRSQRLTGRLRRVMRPALAGIAAAVLAILAVGYFVNGGAAEGRVAGWTHAATSWVSRQWSDFLRPRIVRAPNRRRLTTARGTRADFYRVAIDGFEAHPLRGDGAGGFEVRWMRERQVEERIRDAHSLYLETIGELGLVGGMLLLGFMGSLLAAIIRSRIRPVGLSRTQAAAVGAACTVWVGHSAVDWDWEIPALTGTALVLAASAYPHGRRAGRRPGAPAAPTRALASDSGVRAG